MTSHMKLIQRRLINCQAIINCQTIRNCQAIINCQAIRNLFYMNSNKYFSTCSGKNDINGNNISTLKPQELRKLSENCSYKKITDVLLWSSIAKNASDKYNDFKYFDALLLLSSFDTMNLYDKHLYEQFSHVFIKQIHLFEVKHLLLLINLYYKVNLFPRILFIQVFHYLAKNCNKFYPDECKDILICFAKLGIINTNLIKILCKNIVKNINLYDYCTLCSIVGSLRLLSINDDVFYYVVDEKQEKELKLLTVQELFDNIKKIKLLVYCWELYEKNLMNEFLTQLNNFKNEKDVDQLDDPFICLNFLISKNLVNNNFLLALSKWCLKRVYEYPSRSSKRPLSHELIKLYEIMKENNVKNFDFIEKAIHRFVITRGGLEVNRDKMWKPVSYQKGRKYIYASD
ncbi:heptatricopeptide repeat-containing protein HPR1, putative, partial [Hepatocystis sp. ex Piliocolobus tephrosceles]